MNKLCISVFLLVLSAGLYGQMPYIKNSGLLVISDTERMEGFYITLEGKIVSGIWMKKLSRKERNNELLIPQQPNHAGALFHPQDILGYGLTNGVRYYSATIYLDGKEKNVFLEELLQNEDMAMYAYEGEKGPLFYIQKEDETLELIEDEGEELRNYLRSKAADCKKVKEIDRHPMRMARSSIVDMYNAYTNCNTNLFSRIRFGVTVGVPVNLLQVGNNHDYKYDKKVTVYPGLFVEIPLDSRFSFRPELLYTSINVTGKPDRTINRGVGAEYKRTAIQLPILFRCTFNGLSGKYLPYVEFGPTVDARLSGKKGTEEMAKLHQVSSLQLGAALGAGVEFRITQHLSLYAGFRYGFSSGSSPDEDKETYNVPSLNLAIGF